MSQSRIEAISRGEGIKEVRQRGSFESFRIHFECLKQGLSEGPRERMKLG